jgi:hypothetical protein
MGKVGEGESDNKGKQGREKAGGDCIKESCDIGIIFEDYFKKSEGKLTIDVKESALDNFPNGPEKEATEEEDGNDEYGEGENSCHRFYFRSEFIF